jgi:hypothetical protein
MSQPWPNADQAPRRFSASARSSLRWCWNSAVSGVCLGAESEGHHNNGERRFRVEQRTSAGGPPDDALAPIPAVRVSEIRPLQSALTAILAHGKSVKLRPDGRRGESASVAERRSKGRTGSPVLRRSGTWRRSPPLAWTLFRPLSPARRRPWRSPPSRLGRRARSAPGRRPD